MKSFVRILLSPIWIPLFLIVNGVIYVVLAIAACITWLVTARTLRQSWNAVEEFLS